VGANVRVAIIDSGVHASHPHVQGIAGGVGIDDFGNTHADYVDRLGHGTAVAAVIREKAPDAELLAVKVFDRVLTATGPALVAALAWARQADAQILNLSLGTTNVDHEPQLQAEIDAARAHGIIVIAAGPDGQSRWLPGALHGVVRVTLDMTLSRDQCRAALSPDGVVTIAASGYPRPIPGVPPERNLWGLSFAVANVTGLAARAWPDWESALLRRQDTAQ
jgi:subtilisin family serine protease